MMQVMVECLSLLGRCLTAPVPAPASTSGQQQPQPQPGQQQKEEPAYAALSRWAHKALQQQEPEVRSVPLVRGLLELYIRCHGVYRGRTLAMRLGYARTFTDSQQRASITQV